MYELYCVIGRGSKIVFWIRALCLQEDKMSLWVESGMLIRKF